MLCSVAFKSARSLLASEELASSLSAMRETLREERCPFEVLNDKTWAQNAGFDRHFTKLLGPGQLEGVL